MGIVRPQSINLPTVFELDAAQVVSLPINATEDVSAAVQAAIDAASAGGQRTGGLARLVFPAGVYRCARTIVHRPGVEVCGVGRGTIFEQLDGATPLWSFQTGVIRGGIRDCLMFGQGQATGAIADRVGVGIDVTGASFVLISNVEVWDFALGLQLSDGITPFSGYNTIGPDFEANRCTIGIRALRHCNASRIVGSRVFYSFGLADDGIGIDIDDVASLNVEGNAFESCDTCVRVRATDGVTLKTSIFGNYFEPGNNPISGQIGACDDIELPDAELPLVVGFANTFSGNRGRVILPPSGLSKWDGYAQPFAGARYDGAAAVKRNLVYNGSVLYFNAAATATPNWTFINGVGVAASGTFVSGNRSLQLTAVGTTSQARVGFQAPDEVGWMTIGIRYQVVSGAGFIVNADWGANTAQLIDEDVSGGVWQTRYIQVQRDPAASSGTVSIFPDAVAGTGVVLVDEVWAQAGRYATEASSYGERVQMLPAPIVISDQTLTGNGTFGPINILDLPNLLAPPLADFCTAPPGVIGAIYRFEIETDTGVLGTALAQRHSMVPTTPGATGVVAAVNTWLVSPQYSQVPVNQQIAIRGTSLVGVINAGDGASTQYQIALVGWILA